MKREFRQRVGLVTYSELSQLSDGDRLLQNALVARSLDAEPVVWDDPGVDWSLFDVCIIRSTWDYHHRHEEFMQWVDQVSTVTALWNPAEVVRWNSHKGYLLDLHLRGVPIVPTELLHSGSSADLGQLVEKRGWEVSVVKPAVSAAAHSTVVVQSPRSKVESQGLKQEVLTLAEGQAHLDKLLAIGDVLVQPYFASVETYRERSLLFVRGELTHVVSRPPVLSVGLAHNDYALVTSSDDEVALAREAIRLTEYETLYARVDIVRDDAGNPCLLELELVEPSLFLDLSPFAVERLADAIGTLPGD